ncbi:TPA: hypothetical protein QHW78_003854 [Klebsiella aerogenes]|uniref:hypothetical protein n=1 Tax=Klebsiella aerogenes TaxID=548 RepID=UPI0013D573F3|nr:hypothetical protein [Klebsiella aerogenes]HDS4384030.1 hypothetical protein [Klebsiella aerogenes]
MSEQYDAKIIHINSDYTQFVINKGDIDNIRKGMTFLIYSLGEKIIDPDTGLNLGQLEIIKGEAIVHHVQEKMTTLISREYIEEPEKEETIYNENDIFASRRRLIGGLYGNNYHPARKVRISPEKKIKPLYNVIIGDFVRRVK